MKNDAYESRMGFLFNEASEAYRRAFPEEGCFPTEMAPPMSDEELIEFIWECIRKGKPYKPYLPEGCIP